MKCGKQKKRARSLTRKKCTPVIQRARRRRSARSRCRALRNPYLNFCREFRNNHVGLRAVEVIKQAAAAWRVLPDSDKIKFIVAAFYARRRYSRKRRVESCKLLLSGPHKRNKRKGKKAKAKKVKFNRC